MTRLNLPPPLRCLNINCYHYFWVVKIVFFFLAISSQVLLPLQFSTETVSQKSFHLQNGKNQHSQHWHSALHKGINIAYKDHLKQILNNHIEDRRLVHS